MAGGDSDADVNRLQARIAELESELEAAKNEAKVRRTRDTWFRGLVEIAPDAMIVHGNDKQIIYINPAGVRLFGATSEDQIVGTLASSFIHPDSRHTVERDMQNVLSGAVPSKSNFEQRRLRLDGSEFFADTTATAVVWDDRPAALVVVHDISNRIRARTKYEASEARRREAHTRLTDAIEAMSEGIALFDANDRLQVFNQQYAKHFSGSARDIIRPGVAFDDIVSAFVKQKSSVQAATKLAEQAVDRHRNLPSEAEIKYESGRWLRQSKMRTREGGVLAIYTDITEQKAREQVLRDSESRHRRMLEVLPVAVLISVDGKIVFANAAAAEMFGAAEVDDLVGRKTHSLASPASREVLGERLRKVLSEQCTLPPLEQERLRLDGSSFDAESVATFMMWEGKPAIIGVFRDITERKKAERALAETERRLSAVADHIMGAVYQCVHAPDNTVQFTYVSAGVFDVTGLTPDQISEDAARFIALVRPDFREKYLAHFHESARDMVPADLEFPIQTRDGRERWLHTTGRPQRRRDGSFVWDGIMIDVTDKKIAQETAERNYQWLHKAIESMPIGFMLWDRDNKLVLWNKRMERYHPDPAIFHDGLTFDDALEAPYQDFVARLGKEPANSWLAKRKRQHVSAKGHFEFQARGDTWFSVSERRTPDGFTLTMLADVSEQYRSQALLRETEARYRALINLSPDAIYVHKKGIITVCNEATSRLFGATSADDLIGRDILDLTHPDFRNEARIRRSMVVEEGTRTLSMRQKRLRLDGSWFWADVAAAAIKWDGERGGIVVLRDVSTQIAAEEELIRSKEAAELASRAKTEFLANVSHELRTPLNAIIGFSDLMQREMLGPLGNEQYASYIRDIHQSGTHLHDVINDILDLSKIEAGQMELRESPIDVKKTIERCIRVVATRADDRGLRLVTDLPDKLPFIVADERKFKQILINLMSNSVKFTDKGGEIMVTADASPETGVTIRVSDTGIGIDAENLAKVFRPFEQVDSSLSRVQDGTGLGLPLTKSLVELHGGTLKLESEVGVGTQITVSFPAARISTRPLAAE